MLLYIIVIINIAFLFKEKDDSLMFIQIYLLSYSLMNKNRIIDEKKTSINFNNIEFHL